MKIRAAHSLLKFTRRFWLVAVIALFYPCAQATEIDLRDCMRKTEVRRSSAYPDPSYDELRARRLLAAGHAEESIAWFLKELQVPEQKLYSTEEGKYVVSPWRGSLEAACGQAYENVGNYPEALKHFEKATLFYGGEKQAKLLTKLGRFKEAKSIATRGVLQCRDFDAKHQYRSPQSDLSNWLRLRASASLGLGLQKSALIDLKEAALNYSQYSTAEMNRTVDEYNRVQEQSGASSRLAISADSLPQVERERVMQLLHCLCSSKIPITTSIVNKLTSATLKVPGSIFPDSDQQDKVAPPFYQVEYRTTKKLAPNSCLLQVTLWTRNCAIDRKTILKTMPPKRLAHSEIYSYFKPGALMENAEAWNTPGGTLILSFASSGLEVLEEIEWRGKAIEITDGPSSVDGQMVLAERSLIHDKPAAALEHLSKAIELSRKKKYDPDDLSDYYIERARIQKLLQRKDLAAADASEAVRIGGLKHLPVQVEYLVLARKRREAISVLLEAIQSSAFERERSEFRLLLANLYLANKEFSRAIETAEACIRAEDAPSYYAANNRAAYMDKNFAETERMSAPAHVIKAKAELALGKFSDARADSDAAAKKFFDIANVCCRDRVREWAKQIP